MPTRDSTPPIVCFRHINARLDAVTELSGALSPEADASRALLKKLPDVERLLSRVHSMASKHRSSEHPESRAIMYEGTKYSIRKVCVPFNTWKRIVLAGEVKSPKQKLVNR